MKRLLLVVVALALMASVAYGQSWVPTPMVIDAKDKVYLFDGSPTEVQFDLSGKPAKIWMVVESNLKANKPVAVTNGFKNWHFVNGIDTTIYVSSSLTFEPGTGLVFPWDGRGNEVEYGTPNKVVSGIVPPGEYTYYLWGYDYVSNRENACDFIAIGNVWEAQYDKFYTEDEAGLPLAQPLLMGTLPLQPNHYGRSTRLIDGDIFKWTMGNDPLNEGLLVTSHMFGFTTGAIEAGNRFKYGSGDFLPNDYSTFIFANCRWWTNESTVVKWTFVDDGEAVQDESWGGFDNISWNWPATKSGNNGDALHPNLLTDGTYIYLLDPGQNPMQYPHDKFHILDVEDPTNELWFYNLREFYMPNQPANDGPTTGAARTNSEINRLYRSNVAGQFFVTGDWTCLSEVIDVNRMLTSGKYDPWSAEGYVVWANSNGDFFMDMASNPQNLRFPEQLWACIVSDDRLESNQREDLSPADENGFWVSNMEFTGVYAIGVYAPDGSGIDRMQFADDQYATGEPAERKRSGGETLDGGSIYDGIYQNLAQTADTGTDSAATQKVMWFASDSDRAIITNGSAVEADKAPATFAVAQNSPNPFNPTTTISFTLAKEGNVSVDVFNVAGQKVDTLANGFMTIGSHSVTWDASNFAAGMYFYTVKSGSYSKTVKMTLLK